MREWLITLRLISRTFNGYARRERACLYYSFGGAAGRAGVREDEERESGEVVFHCDSGRDGGGGGGGDSGGEVMMLWW